jgi:hypothetical protein
MIRQYYAPAVPRRRQPESILNGVLRAAGCNRDTGRWEHHGRTVRHGNCPIIP